MLRMNVGRKKLQTDGPGEAQSKVLMDLEKLNRKS
jgi:hypothetical protein